MHRKASNVGVWGESGRYPLIYQAIRLTLNYFKRLSNLTDGTFIKAALYEQKTLNLPWFKNIEPLLKLDEIFHQDHVTAFRTLKNKQTSIRTTNSNVMQTIKPLPSRKFRVQNIIKSLTDHFIECWEHEKSSSSKLSFYNVCKKKFAKEPYLDVSKGFSRRYNTTKIRISSHDLEIECGRYNKITREARICTWCNMTMGINVVEDENHLINDCDLYANVRNKLINRLKNAPNSQLQNLINRESLKTQFHNLLSPYSSTQQYDHDNVFSSHHCDSNNRNEASEQERKYIINCICTFLCHAVETRRKFIKEVRERENKANTLVINFTNNQNT